MASHVLVCHSPLLFATFWEWLAAIYFRYGGPARRFLPPPLPLQRQRQLQDLFLRMWSKVMLSVVFAPLFFWYICVSSLQIPPISQSSFNSCCYQEATDVQFGHLPPAKDARMVGRTTGLATSPSPPEIRRLVRYGVVHLTCCIQWENINHDLCWWTQPKCNTGHLWYSGRVCRTWQENNANSNTIHTPTVNHHFSPKLCLYASKCRNDFLPKQSSLWSSWTQPSTFQSVQGSASKTCCTFHPSAGCRGVLGSKPLVRPQDP